MLSVCSGFFARAAPLALLLTLTQPSFLNLLNCSSVEDLETALVAAARAKGSCKTVFEQCVIYFCGPLGAVSVLEKLSSDLYWEKEPREPS